MAKNEESKLRTKLDSFWRVLFLTPEGRPKSSVLLYGFCLSIIFMLLYGLSYFFLIDVLEQLFAEASVTVRNVFEAVIPGLVGSMVICPLWFVFKNKRLMPAAFIWLIAFALIAIPLMALLTGDAQSFGIFMYFYAMIVPTGLVTGAVFTFLMYAAHLRDNEKLGVDA